MSRALHVLDNSFHLMRPFRRRRASTAGGLTGRSRTGHNGPCGWSGRWPPCDLPTSFGLRGPKQSLGVPSAVLDGVGSLICSRSLGPFCLALCSISGAQAFFSAADDALSPRCAVLMNCVPARRACALCLCGYWTGVHGCPPRLCPRAVGSPTALSWRACSHPQRSPPPMMGSPGGVGSPLRGGGGGATSTSSIRQLLGTADTQTAHPAATSTAPTHQRLGSANAETTPAGAPAAAADRTQRPDATCEGTNG